MGDMGKVTSRVSGLGNFLGVIAGAIGWIAIVQAHAAPGPSVKLPKSPPPKFELSPFAGRGPASVSAPGGSPSNSVLGLLLKGEPGWYRNTAALGHISTWPSPEPNWALGGSRAPAHPSDGMWRSYDSPGLSR